MGSLDNLSFAASVGASMLSDRIESARCSAREAAESAATTVAARAASVRAQAESVAERAAAMDINSALELGQANAAALRDSAAQSASTLGNKITSISVDDFRNLASPGGTVSQRPPSGEDGGDSSADESSYAASGSFGGMASRLGFGAVRSPEKEGLLKQPGSAEGSASAAGGSAASLAAGGLATLRSMSERTLSTGSGLAKSVGSGLGLVEEKPREPEGLLDRMCYRMCSCCPKLTRGQQLLGFFVCFLFGTLLSISALGSLPSLLIGNPAPFAFKHTFGNLCGPAYTNPMRACAPDGASPRHANVNDRLLSVCTRARLRETQAVSQLVVLSGRAVEAVSGHAAARATHRIAPLPLVPHRCAPPLAGRAFASLLFPSCRTALSLCPLIGPADLSFSPVSACRDSRLGLLAQVANHLLWLCRRAVRGTHMVHDVVRAIRTAVPQTDRRSADALNEPPVVPRWRVAARTRPRACRRAERVGD